MDVGMSVDNRDRASGIPDGPLRSVLQACGASLVLQRGKVLLTRTTCVANTTSVDFLAPQILAFSGARRDLPR